jgi:DNA-binding IclR family transcriptional regulator
MEGLDGRIVDALTESGEPMAARLLADKLGVPLDALARPLKELRDAGRITKRGDKRATKYLLKSE